MINWECKRCAEGLEAPECLIGEYLRCPSCKRLCRVPQESIENEDRSDELVAVGARTSEAAAHADEVSLESRASAHAESESAEPAIDIEIAEHQELVADESDESQTEALIEVASPITPVAAEAAAEEEAVTEARELPEVDGEENQVVVIAAQIATDDAEELVIDEITIADEPDAALSTNGAADHADDLDERSTSDILTHAAETEFTSVNGTHHYDEEEAEASSEESVATLTESRLDEQRTPLEIALDEIAPVVQRQLGPAVAQYSAREQAGSAMFSRAVVDVHLSKLDVRSHDDDRIVLMLRYRRTRRRTMIGVKPLPTLTIEASFVPDDDGTWSLERWQRIHAI